MTDSTSKEMKALTTLFDDAGRAKKDARRAIDSCNLLAKTGSDSAGIAAAILSHVEYAWSVNIKAISAQIDQQKKIEELEKRLAELETPSVVKLSKTPSVKP